MVERSSTLRLIIDSSDAVTAANRLDRMGDEASRAARNTDGVTGAASRMGAALRLAATAAASLGGALAFREGLQAAATFDQLSNRLRLVTENSDQLAAVQRDLFGVSQRTFSTIEATTQLYQRLAASSRDLGLSQERLVGITTTVNQALQISGTSAQAAEAALIQFGQALESGVLSGDEFRSIREQAPALAQAIADGLGVTQGELRKLAEDQALTTEIVVGALEKQADAVAAQVGRFEVTLPQALSNLRNSVQVAAAGIFGPLDDELTVIIRDISRALSDPSFVEGARQFGEQLAAALRTAEALVTTLSGVAAFIGRMAQQAGDFASGIAGAILPFSADEFAAEFRPTLEALEDLGRLQREIRGSRLIETEVDQAGIDQIADKLEVVKRLGGEIRIGGQAIESAEQFRRAVDEVGLSAEEVFQLFQRQGAFIFPNPQGSAAQNAFSRPQFQPRDLIVRTQDEIEALQKLQEEARKAQEEVDALFSARITQPFENAAALLEAARAGDASLENARDRLEIEEEIADLRASYERNGLRFSEALEKSARETLKATQELEDAIERLARQRLQNENFIFDSELGRARDAGNAFGRGEINTRELQRVLEGQLERLGEELRQGNISPERFEELQREIITGIDRSTSVNRGGFDDVVGAIDRSALDIASELAGFTENLFNNLRGALQSIREGGLEGITRGIGQIGQSIGDGLGRLSDLLPALGPVGQAIAVGGQIVSAVSSVVGFFKDLFGKPSNNFARGLFDPTTGAVTQISQKDNGADETFQNAAARDEFIDTLREVFGAIADITGAEIAEKFAIEINSRDGIKIGTGGFGPRGGPLNEQVFQDAEQAIDAAVKIAVGALEGGNQTFVDYAKAAVAAGRDTEQLIGGLQDLSAVLQLGAEPLSQVEQQLKALDDTINPVIADLESLGQSIAGISQVAQDAARAIGENFIRGIEDDIAEFQNATLAQFRQILRAQEQLVKDAQTLLNRGAITPAEFDLVQVRNSLERQRFFENLSPEELESVGDYLGLIQESGGSVAVVLTLIQDAFTDFVDNVEETRLRLQEQADQLQAAADRIFATRDRIDLRFPSLSGGELLGDLRGQLANLREQALAGDNTAFERIPELADRFVNLARDIFGSTADFAEQRDFALGVLDQTGALAQSRADRLLTEIEALNTQVEVLNDIREALESPDPAIELIRAQLDQGNVTNELLRDLLQQYVALSQTAQANALTPSQVQAAATAALGVGGSSAATPVAVDFSDVIVNLSQVRQTIAAGNAATVDVLNRLLNETRNQRTTATLTR